MRDLNMPNVLFRQLGVRSGSPVVDLNQRTGSRRCVLHESVRGQERTIDTSFAILDN
ncbi:hypothetical protein PSAB6_660009 [Paraburkholderia sabiae]|nr:hypothetical protein PSAB6_660009 [Paraburkholderia sabiae]